MSFFAGSDRIYITDTNGAIVFDTNNDIPHILGVYETNIKKVFYEQYYTEQYFTIGDLPDDCDFVIVRAKCVPFNLLNIGYDKNNPEAGGMTGGERGQGGWEYLGSSGRRQRVDWAVLASEGGSFFQGSLPLETGQTMVWMGGGYSASQYCRRVLHVYPEPAWGNKLVAMFQQSVKSGYGAVPSLAGQAYNSTTSKLIPVAIDDDHPAVVYGPAGIRWEVNLKVWAGKFRA